MNPLIEKVLTNKSSDHTGINLAGADLSGADLSGADLSNANLEGANLSGTDLSEADLSGANLQEADLSESDLFGANLTGANLSKTNLTFADLRGSTLCKAKMQNITHGGFYLEGADLSGIDLGVKIPSAPYLIGIMEAYLASGEYKKYGWNYSVEYMVSQIMGLGNGQMGTIVLAQVFPGRGLQPMTLEELAKLKQAINETYE